MYIDHTAEEAARAAADWATGRRVTRARLEGLREGLAQAATLADQVAARGAACTARADGARQAGAAIRAAIHGHPEPAPVRRGDLSDRTLDDDYAMRLLRCRATSRGVLLARAHGHSHPITISQAEALVRRGTNTWRFDGTTSATHRHLSIEDEIGVTTLVCLHHRDEACHGGGDV